jgi:hypothetical protein
MSPGDLRVRRAVNDAKATSGLEFCVVLCPGGDALGRQAEEALDGLGLIGRPSVLVAAHVASGAIDVFLGPGCDGRIGTRDAQEVLQVCAPRPDESIEDRIAAVVLTLADRAGPGAPDPEAPHLPDVVTS